MEMTQEEIDGLVISSVKNLTDKFYASYMSDGKEIKVTDPEPPNESLVESLDALKPFALATLDFAPGEINKRLTKTTIKGINVAYKGERYQAQIIYQYQNNNGDTMSFNTNSLPVEVNESEYGNKAEIPSHWDKKAYDAFEKVLEETRAYIGGIHDQQRLNFDGEEDPEEE